MASDLLSIGSETADLSAQDLREGLFQALGALGPRRKVLCIPPDITRHPSRAGELTRYAWEFYGDRLAAILGCETRRLFELGTIEALMDSLANQFIRPAETVARWREHE